MQKLISTILLALIVFSPFSVFAEEKLEKQLNDEALGIAVNDSSTSVINAWAELKNSLSKPGTILTIAGTTFVIVGGSAICIATAPVCATVLAYTGVVIGTGFTVNGVKVITTGSNIFGTPVSDTEWGKAVIMLPIDAAGTILSVSALKAILVSKYGVTAADNMVGVMARGTGEEVALVKNEVLPVVRAVTNATNPLNNAMSKLLTITERETILSAIQNQSLKNAFSYLYKIEDKFPGGTAGAIVQEFKTGTLLSNSGHVVTATERVTSLVNILKTPGLSQGDIEVANLLLKQLRDALTLIVK